MVLEEARSLEGGQRRRVFPCAWSRDLSFWVSLLMGGQPSYARCPRSPTEMPKESSSPTWKLWATACGFAVTLALLLTFLGLYVKLRLECESRPWNHTSSSSSEGRMAESDQFQAQLAAVHQSLANTTERWDSCRAELKHSRENTSVLEDDIQKKEEALRHLDGEKNSLQEQLTNLKSTLESWKREREEKDKTIQDLKDQLKAQQQASSGVVLFGGPVPPSLLIIVPGLLCSLL